MKDKKIIIAGGTGFIGQALAARWGKDNRIVILGRQHPQTRNNAYGRQMLTAAEGYHTTFWRWDQRLRPRHQPGWTQCQLPL